MVAEEVTVAVHHVGVGRHEVEGLLAAGGDDSGWPVAFRDDPIDGSVEADFAAQILDEAHHAFHQRARAAAGEMHAPLALERMDQRIDGGGLERIAADQQRMELKACRSRSSMMKRATIAWTERNASSRTSVGATRIMLWKEWNGTAPSFT